MRDYGKIATSIWNSQKFRSFAPEDRDDARLLYFYLHTCESVNSVGCFVLKEGAALDDLGWDSQRYRKAMDSLSIAYLIAIDRAERLVRIIDFLKFDPFTNSKHAKGALKIAESLPECAEKDLLFIDIAKCKFSPFRPGNTQFSRHTDSLSIGYRNPIDTPNPNPNPSPSKTIDDDEEEDETRKKIDENSISESLPQSSSFDLETDQGLYSAVVIAARVDTSKGVPTRWRPPAAILEVARWRGLGLSGREIVDVSASCGATYKDPPNGPIALHWAMLRLAKAKAQDPLTPPDAPPTPPVTGGTSHARSSNSEAKAEKLSRIIRNAARGTT